MLAKYINVVIVYEHDPNNSPVNENTLFIQSSNILAHTTQKALITRSIQYFNVALFHSIALSFASLLFVSAVFPVALTIRLTNCGGRYTE